MRDDNWNCDVTGCPAPHHRTEVIVCNGVALGRLCEGHAPAWRASDEEREAFLAVARFMDDDKSKASAIPIYERFLASEQRDLLSKDLHGTMECPICGVAEPHHHAQHEVDRWRELATAPAPEKERTP